MSLDLTAAQLYERYGHLVFRRAMMFLASEAEAEDATQEVFIKAMGKLGDFRGESAISTWLYRITTNHCLNLLRSKKRRQRRHEEHGEGVLGLSKADLEQAAIVRELLPRFDRRSQRAVWAYFVDEMTQREVAEEIGVSLPTLRKILNRFLERARKKMNVEAAHD